MCFAGHAAPSSEAAHPSASQSASPSESGADAVETVAVAVPSGPVHPGFDVGVTDRHRNTCRPADSGTWHRMGILYDHVAQVVSGHDLPVAGRLRGLHHQPWVSSLASSGPGATRASSGSQTPTARLSTPNHESPSPATRRPPLERSPSHRDTDLAHGTTASPHTGVAGGARRRPRHRPRRSQTSASGSQVERRELDSAQTDLPQGDLHLHVDIDICDPKLVPDLLFPGRGARPSTM